MYPCPDDWWYLESTDEEDGEVFFVYACSEECKARVWMKGPGTKFNRFDVPFGELQ